MGGELVDWIADSAAAEVALGSGFRALLGDLVL